MMKSFRCRLVCKVGLLGAVSLSAYAIGPPDERSSPSPSFSLTISLARNAIGANTEEPLEVTITNISKHDIWFYPMEQPWPWFADCWVDLRDRKGRAPSDRPLTEFKARALRPYLTTANIAIALKPGKQLQVEILLNRFYDLSRPGQYTIQAHRRDDSGMIVNSNTITARFGETFRPGKGSKPPFSITLRVGAEEVVAGTTVQATIAVTNVSKHHVNLAIWRGVTSAGMTTDIPDEFASGLEIRDSQDRPAPLTKMGQDLLNYEDVPAGRFHFTWLRPGRTEEQRRDISLYDLSRPGEYTLQVTLMDPASHLQVKSNPVKVTVVAAAR